MSKRHQQPIPARSTVQKAVEQALKHPVEQASPELLALQAALVEAVKIVPLMKNFSGDLMLLNTDLSSQRIDSARRSLHAMSAALERAAAVIADFEAKKAAAAETPTNASELH